MGKKRRTAGRGLGRPPPPHFTEGWQLGTPDLVLDTSSIYTLPTSGPDVFWNFIFSPNLDTKRYVRAIEVRPGDAHAVHHANVLIDPSKRARSREAHLARAFREWTSPSNAVHSISIATFFSGSRAARRGSSRMVWPGNSIPATT